MSYNDRLREACVWVAAHPGETITVSIPKADLAEALWTAADDCRWQPALSSWARDLASKTRGMCAVCYDAAAPLDRWEGLAAPQPTHADCAGGGCTCPCHEARRHRHARTEAAPEHLTTQWCPTHDRPYLHECRYCRDGQSLDAAGTTPPEDLRARMRADVVAAQDLTKGREYR